MEIDSKFIMRSDALTQVKPRGFLATGVEIVQKETALGLYKGLGAVLGGIIPKMAIRFTSYEYYKTLLASKETGQISRKGTFIGTGIIPREPYYLRGTLTVVFVRL